MSNMGFDFFDKPKEIKKKAKVKCTWCKEQTGNLTQHLKTCEIYLKEKAEKAKIIPKDNFQEKIQKQIDNLVNKNKELTDMILLSRETMIKEKDPVIKALLQDIKARNIDNITEELMIELDLKRFDYYIGSNHFLSNMGNIKKVIDSQKEPDKYQIARFINRIYKGDRAMYRVLIKYLNERDQKVIDKYTNGGD